MNYITTCPSPIGMLTLASDGEALTGLWIEGQKYFLSSLRNSAEENKELAVFQSARSWLKRYFSGKKPDIGELLLRPSGSPFRQEIWKLLCRIPYGETTTYGTLAREAAKQLNRSTMSAQAVGGAVAHNPISIIIPCHRVIGADGSLTGYAGGIDLKIRLLELEGVDLSGLYVPKSSSAP